MKTLIMAGLILALPITLEGIWPGMQSLPNPIYRTKVVSRNNGVCLSGAVCRTEAVCRTHSISSIISSCQADESSPIEKYPQAKTTEPAGFRKTKLYYDNTSGEKGVTTYLYDSKGILYRAVWELLDGSRSSINTYRYDQAGRLVEIYRDFSDQITSSETYEYDDRQNKIAEHFSRSDGVTGLAVFFYDDRNRLIEQRCTRYKGWITGTIYFEYGEDQQPQRAVLKELDSVKAVIRYTYNFSDIPDRGGLPDQGGQLNHNGRLAVETWDFNGQWQQVFRYEYESLNCPHYSLSSPFCANTCRFRLVREDYDYSGKTGGPSDYIYGPGGQLLEKRFVRRDGLETATRYEYDSSGLLMASYRAYSDQSQAIFRYEYNPERQLIRRHFIKDQKPIGLEEYRYDSDGRLVSAVWDNFDQWLSGTITFEYDRYDRFVKGIFEGRKGLTAQIRFEYDADRNLVLIRWDFNSGNYQTYRFTYQAPGDTGQPVPDSSTDQPE